MLRHEIGDGRICVAFLRFFDLGIHQITVRGSLDPAATIVGAVTHLGTGDLEVIAGPD